MTKKKISIIGSTGSIGRQTLEVIDLYSNRFEVVALAAGSNIDLLIEQVAKYKPQLVCIGNEKLYNEFKERLSSLNVKCNVVSGKEGLVDAAVLEDVNTVVTSITGTLGLIPTVEAIKAGKNIALANKETLVAAGSIVMSLASKYGVNILPVDSEHSAIFQSLKGENIKSINKLLLTASGGPFRGKRREELMGVTPEIALKHPTWSMGAKITIDSATLMNKGLEVIEARWLFDIDFPRIEVVVHPQSIIHSMVEYVDGSIIGQMGLPDMKLPIQYALTFPERWENNFPRLNFREVQQLTFAEPDLETFECLDLAYKAGQMGGTMPAAMNAANEEVVSMFINKKIKFLDIAHIISKVMENHKVIENPTLDNVLEVDRWAREEAISLMS